ncbi:MAG TPA: SpoIIE family protein phosphatase, partial [Vicinamibacteria bacterium]|nr:SpoIIE family protein phosphatase [Vicinamibacteria bacterium]
MDPTLAHDDSYLRIHAVRVFVRDQERSLRFYVDQLGFRVAFDAQLGHGQRWVAVAPPDGTAVLSLVAPSPRSPEHKLIGRATPVVFVTEDVPAKFREWRRRGVRFRHTPRLRRVHYERAPAEAPAGAGSIDGEPAWGAVFTRFEDLDGNTFALVSFDEETRAVEAQRRALAEQLEAERRTAHELEIARQVQARLFPQTLPHANTLEYAGLCIQARQVGGDYYDFLNLGQERLGLVIGDIAGKGIAAALLMANLQANLRSQCAIALEQPQRFLRAVNQLFCANTLDSSYATLFFAEYDDRAQRLRYANCGHLYGL